MPLRFPARRSIDEPATPIEFRTEPLVVGVIGPDASTVSARLDAPLRRVVRRPGLEIRSSMRLRAVAGPTGWFWNPLGPSGNVSTQHDLQHTARAAGVIDADGWTLLTDVLGLQPLHHAEIDGHIVFSNRLAMLRRLLPGLRADPGGWTSVFTIGAPLPGQSLFGAISTLPAGGAVRLTGSGPAVTRPALPPSRESTSGDLLESLRASLDGVPRRAAITLSGGWDSRLLAAVLVETGRRPEAWTTSPDDGLDLDVHLAAPVADALGLEHRVVIPPGDAWQASVHETRSRFEYRTWMHTWLTPLAREVRARGLPVVDGLGGDVLLKGLFQRTADDGAQPDADRRRQLYDRLGGRTVERTQVWSAGARSLFETVGFESFDASIQPYLDRPDWQALAILTTRTARLISLSPLRLFGPELDVHTPFLDAEPLAISLGLHRRRGDDFYRELLATVHPHVAGLPSTNDTPRPHADRIPRRLMSPGAMASIIAEVAPCEPALDLLADELRRTIVERDVDDLQRRAAEGAIYPLQAVATYAAWCNAHPDVDSGIV